MPAAVPQWLLDGQGLVLGGSAAALEETEGLFPGLVPGRSLLQWLEAGALGGDTDALALHHGLQAVLSQRQARFEHQGGRWQAQVDAVSPRLPVAALLTVHVVPAAAAADDERATLRHELAAARARLTAVQAVAGLGTWQVDLDRRHVEYAPETYRVLHRDPSLGPLSGIDLRERAHPDDLPSMLDARRRLHGGEPLVRSRFRLRCDDGVERWLETRITLESAQAGRGPMIVGTVRDVSDLMRAQQELERHRERLEDLVVSRTVKLAEASQRAEAAGRARHTLLSHTSHEIRTPLNVIVSLAHLLRRSLPDAATIERVQAIEQAAQHLATIVDEVLDLAHGGADGDAPARPVDPAQLLGEVAAILGPSLLARGLRLRVQAQPSARALSGDALRVRQAVFSAAAWAATAAASGDVLLSAQLSDAGAGSATLHIAAEALLAAAPPTLDEHPDLATLAHLAAHLGGRAGMQPLGDRRWRCSFAVPLTAHAPSPSVPVTPDPDPLPAAAESAPGLTGAALRLRERHGGRRVLVAEDDDINQMALLELLAEVGLQVDTVDDGRAAVEQAALRPYALVLLDLRMPRMDGLAAARAIRSLPGLQATPLIAVSANAFDDDRQACRAAGMNDFLPKPIEVGLLYDTLLRWLEPEAAALPPSPAGAAGASAAARAVDPAIVPLLGLEGIDAEGGLAAVGGRVEVYRRLLRVFGQTHADDGLAAQRLLAAGDAAAVCALAHRVRGSAATLGLVDVETAAAELEYALDGRAPADRADVLATRFSAALDGTVQRLQQALAGSGGVPARTAAHTPSVPEG